MKGLKVHEVATCFCVIVFDNICETDDILVAHLVRYEYFSNILQGCNLALFNN